MANICVLSVLMAVFRATFQTGSSFYGTLVCNIMNLVDKMILQVN